MSFLGLVVAPVAGSKSASQICWRARAAAEEENALAVGGELEAAVAGLGHGELLRLPCRTPGRDGLDQQLRCFGVLVEIDGGDGVGQPLAVGRDGGIAEALHLHHVLEGHGMPNRGGNGLRGLREAERDKDGGKCHKANKRTFAHEIPQFARREKQLRREEKVYTGDGHIEQGARFPRTSEAEPERLRTVL